MPQDTLMLAPKMYYFTHTCIHMHMHACLCARTHTHTNTSFVKYAITALCRTTFSVDLDVLLWYCQIIFFFFLSDHLPVCSVSSLEIHIERKRPGIKCTLEVTCNWNFHCHHQICLLQFYKFVYVFWIYLPDLTDWFITSILSSNSYKRHM